MGIKLVFSLVAFVCLLVAVSVVASSVSVESYVRDALKSNKNPKVVPVKNSIDFQKIVQNQKPSVFEASQELRERNYADVKSHFKSGKNVPVIVWLGKDANPSDIISDFKISNVKFVYTSTNGFAGLVTEKQADSLNSDKRVNYIVYDEIFKAHLPQSRTLIQANVVETNFSLTGQGVGVCHVDSGVNYSHPNLMGAYKGGYDFVNLDSNPMDDNGHGTGTAGVLASNQSIFRGISRNINLVSVKVLDSTATGTFSNLAAGVDWCVTNKNAYNISVITMSLGTSSTYNPSTSPAYIEPSIQNAYDSNIALVASSGNEGSTTGISYPSVSPYVISVGASYDANVGSKTWTLGNSSTCTDSTTSSGTIVCFTNRASFLDLMAPGSVITTTALSGAFTAFSGTSLAVPHVAGTIALMAQRNPNISPSQIETALKSSGVSIVDIPTGITFPRITAYGSVLLTPYLKKIGALGAGATIYFDIVAPMDVGLDYLFGLSVGNAPGFGLGDGRVVPLDVTDTFLLPISLYAPQSISLYNSSGTVTINGNQAVLYLPNVPGLENLNLYSAFVTVNVTDFSVPTVSNSVKL